MRNLKVMMTYRGTNYHGFQYQKNALTVQEVLTNAVSKVLNENITIIGCSRTDTGVHANNFCFNVKTKSTIWNVGFCRGVNSELPGDISILSCEDVNLNFNARFDCKGKEYIYKMHCSESKDPFSADLALQYRRIFDVNKARRAVACLVGTHNFASFCADCTKKSTTVKTIYSFKIEKDGDFVIILVKGNGFLYNMIRIIVGTLIDINENRFSPDDMFDILVARDRFKAGRTAKAHGLYLNKVFY